MSAGDSYEVSLVDGAVVARSTGARATGRPLKTLPKAVREHPEVDRLRRLVEWLDRHAATCLAQVDAWMVSSMPVPTALLARVWPDPAWQGVLRDLVAMGDEPGAVGLLRDVTTSGEPRVVTLDGETVRLSPGTVTLPHPVLLPDLADLREFAAELGVTQRVQQLERTVQPKPPGVGQQPDAPDRIPIEVQNTSSDTQYAVTARATSLGFQVSGGHITCRVWEAGRIVEPTVRIQPSDRVLGDLAWHYPQDRQLRLAEVGPVAWSEGVRMSRALSGNESVGAGT